MGGRASKIRHPAPAAVMQQLKALRANPELLAAGDAQRAELIQLARSTATALETPFETVQRLSYSMLPIVATKIAQDRKIFRTLAAEEKPLGLGGLSEQIGLEPGVLESIMDYLCTQDLAHEDAEGRYSATKLTHRMCGRLFEDTVTHFHESIVPGFLGLNAALKRSESGLTGFNIGRSTDLDYYTWMETQPETRDAFHRYMEDQFKDLPTWTSAIDFQKEFGEGLTSEGVAFVDVAGGQGHQCQLFKDKFPGVPGRVILQDRPEVLEKALAVDGMETQVYDYLTEQPVKGARVYYFRQIMHNNDDETCVKILRSQLPAMGPDSIILIDDKVLPDQKPPADTPGVEYAAGLSLAMRAMFNAQERREAHWRRLFKEASLEAVEMRVFTRFGHTITIARKMR